MQSGRSPIWNVVAELEASSWLECAQLASGDRLMLPSPLRKRVTWCAPAETLPLLAIIEADGAASLRPLTEQSTELRALQEAISLTEGSEKGDVTLAAMATYSQVSLQPDGRLRLSPILAAHLSGGSSDKVWVGAYRNSVRLWSDRDWSIKLSTISVAMREAVAAQGQD